MALDAGHLAGRNPPVSIHTVAVGPAVWRLCGGSGEFSSQESQMFWLHAPVSRYYWNDV